MALQAQRRLIPVVTTTQYGDFNLALVFIILLAKHVIGLLPTKFILFGGKGRTKIVNDN